VDETMTGRIRIMALFASVGNPFEWNTVIQRVINFQCLSGL